MRAATKSYAEKFKLLFPLGLCFFGFAYYFRLNVYATQVGEPFLPFVFQFTHNDSLYQHACIKYLMAFSLRSRSIIVLSWSASNFQIPQP
jgi:hypothetical protein